MKRTIILCYTLLTSLCVFSQIEIRGGVGSSTITNYRASNKTSFHFGVMYGFDIKSNFSVEPGLLYSKEGAHNAMFFYDLNISYIELPVLAKYTIEDTFLKGLSVKLGPYIACAISGTRDNESGSSDKQNIQFSGDNRIDLGTQLEASYKIKRINLYVNYKKGLRAFDHFYPDRSAKISNLRFGIGYTL